MLDNSSLLGSEEAPSDSGTIVHNTPRNGSSAYGDDDSMYGSPRIDTPTPPVKGAAAVVPRPSAAEKKEVHLPPSSDGPMRFTDEQLSIARVVNIVMPKDERLSGVKAAILMGIRGEPVDAMLINVLDFFALESGGNVSVVAENLRSSEPNPYKDMLYVCDDFVY